MHVLQSTALSSYNDYRSHGKQCAMYVQLKVKWKLVWLSCICKAFAWERSQTLLFVPVSQSVYILKHSKPVALCILRTGITNKLRHFSCQCAFLFFVHNLNTEIILGAMARGRSCHAWISCWLSSLCSNTGCTSFSPSLLKLWSGRYDISAPCPGDSLEDSVLA